MASNNIVRLGNQTGSMREALDDYQQGLEDFADGILKSFIETRQLSGMPDEQAARCRAILSDGTFKVTVDGNLHSD